MSTKMLMEMVSQYEDMIGDSQSEVGLGARREIAAIKKAAHLVTVVGQSEAAADRYPEWKAACELLRKIAE